MIRLKTVNQVKAYYCGVRAGIEAGVTLEPSEYSAFIHQKKLALLKEKDIEQERAILQVEQTGEVTL